MSGNDFSCVAEGLFLCDERIFTVVRKDPSWVWDGFFLCRARIPLVWRMDSSCVWEGVKSETETDGATLGPRAYLSPQYTYLLPSPIQHTCVSTQQQSARGIEFVSQDMFESQVLDGIL